MHNNEPKVSPATLITRLNFFFFFLFVSFFCMGEAYNTFDPLRSFGKRECGSSLTDSLLERGNYL